jgi:hypothetical protein
MCRVSSRLSIYKSTKIFCNIALVIEKYTTVHRSNLFRIFQIEKILGKNFEK